MGVWLPLAMASLQQWMIAIVRMFGDKQTRSHIPMPSTADLLRQWQLPMMASVIASADRDAREREKFEALKRLSEKANNGKQVNT